MTGRPGDSSRRVEAAGLKPERTVAEWVAHPFALDDLLRIVCGEDIRTLNAERRLARERGVA